MAGLALVLALAAPAPWPALAQDADSQGAAASQGADLGAAEDLGWSRLVDASGRASWAPSHHRRHHAASSQAAQDIPPDPALSGMAAQLAAWVTLAGDNGARPFAIVDKLAAQVFVFDADGRLAGRRAGAGRSRARRRLLRRDRRQGARRHQSRRSAPRLPAASWPKLRAGQRRQDRDLGRLRRCDLVAPGGHQMNPKEHRLTRNQVVPALEVDHRISFGCINVRRRGFYEGVVLKAFAGGSAIVYILPGHSAARGCVPRPSPRRCRRARSRTTPRRRRPARSWTPPTRRQPSRHRPPAATTQASAAVDYADQAAAQTRPNSTPSRPAMLSQPPRSSRARALDQGEVVPTADPDRAVENQPAQAARPTRPPPVRPLRLRR